VKGLKISTYFFNFDNIIGSTAATYLRASTADDAIPIDCPISSLLLAKQLHKNPTTTDAELTVSGYRGVAVKSNY